MFEKSVIDFLPVLVFISNYWIKDSLNGLLLKFSLILVISCFYSMKLLREVQAIMT